MLSRVAVLTTWPSAAQSFVDIANVGDYYDWIQGPLTDAVYGDTLRWVSKLCFRLHGKAVAVLTLLHASTRAPVRPPVGHPSQCSP